jgi:tetratricopeptide (TPR) repeat protein
MPAGVTLADAIDAFNRGDLQRALDLAQRNPSASRQPECHHLIGLIHCRRGDPDKGVEHLRRAAEVQPWNTGYKVMLARALIDSGNPADVLKMEKPGANAAKAELALWLARAEAADAIANGEAAAEAWTVIATQRRTDPGAWTHLARSLFALKRFNEAESACLKALATSPQDLTGILTLGLIYERTNRLAELDDLLDSALRRDIGKTQLAYLWALREQRAGNLEAAREFLFKSDSSDDPVRWHRLRIKIADRQGDSAAAFDSMIAMNRATADFDAWRARGAEFRKELSDLAALMNRDWASRIPRLGPNPGPTPVFLVGLPRSGTTLLDTFLMGHPSIHVVEEKEILRRAGRLAGPLSELPNSTELTLDRARRAYLDELGSYTDPGFEGTVIDKNPFNMLLTPIIDALFRGAPIIFAKRHPCDAVLSGFMQSYIPNIGMASFLDLADGAELYDAVMRVWELSTELFPLNVHSVAYEELIEDPEHQLRKVISFLGLGWNEQILDHRATAEDRGALTNTSYDQITEPLHSAAVGRWRHYEKQLEPVLPILLPWAKRLGYED